MKISKTHHQVRSGENAGLIKKNPAKKNSSSKRQVFSGDWVFKDEGKEVPMSFNLYDAGENLNFEETKKNIMDRMNSKHLIPMKKLFAQVGLNLVGFKWYSPREYNFEGDNVDLIITVEDREKLKKFILLRKNEIQSMLDKNKSYDGYMALTSSDVDRVIEKIDKDFDVDVMIISFIQKQYPLDMYEDFYDLLYEDEEEGDDK